MSAVSNVFSAVIISVLVLFAVLVVQINEADYFASQFKSNETSFFQKKAESDLDAVLFVSEPNSNLSLIELISSMVYYRKKNFDFGEDRYFNADKTVESVFDSVFGKENYFLKAEHKLSRVRLFFLIDGSRSMQDDVQKISSVLPSIESILEKQDVEVQTKIFIGKNAIDCSNFFGYECQEIDEVFLYQGFPELVGLLGHEYGGGPYALKGDFYEDWASMALFASVNSEKTSISEGVVTLIFPVSDELSTGSEADYCYENFRRYGFNSKTECMVCSTDSGYERSKKTIDFALKEMDSFDYLVFPVIVSGCGIPEEIWKTTGSCGNENCDGCIVGEDNTACYHPEVFNDSSESIKGHMEYFSKEKNGEENFFVVDLSQGYSEEILKQQLLSVLNNHVFFSFESGTFKPEEERISVKRVLPLRGRTVSELTFWAYTEREHYFLGSPESFFGDKPVAVIDLIKDSNPYLIYADGSSSFDPSGGELLFEWKLDGELISTEESFEKLFSEGDEGIHEFYLTVINSEEFDASALKSICVGSESFCEEQEKKKFFVVPIEFSLEDSVFQEFSERHWNNFVSNILCSDKIEKILLMPDDFDSGKGCTSNLLRECIQTPSQAQEILNKIDDCVQLAGYSVSQNDRIFGITSQDISVRMQNGCSNAVAGYTMGIGTENTVLSEYNFVETSTHEIGHTFGLCEEYSLSSWIAQNKVSSFGECKNDYPLECKEFNQELCDNDGVCDYYGFPQRNGNPETCLTCPNPPFDCVSAGSSCGNERCDSGENVGNCPQDCFGIDCFGTTLSDGMHSVMGPAGIDGEIDGFNLISGYEEKGKDHINELICEGN